MAVIVGDLRYVINVKRLAKVKDEYGAVSESYATVYTLKAGVKNMSGTKAISNDEIFNTSTLQFTTWYRTINDSDRIEYNSKKYKILSINEIGFKEGLTITAELINE